MVPQLTRPASSLRRQFIEEKLSREIVGAFYDVYNTLGFGFREVHYSRAMHIALTERGLLVEREFPVEVFFHGHQIGLQRIDMLVEGRIIVETKAAHRITEGDRRQLLSYVSAMNLELGILLHFGPRAEFHRILGAWKPPNT